MRAPQAAQPPNPPVAEPSVRVKRGHRRPTPALKPTQMQALRALDPASRPRYQPAIKSGLTPGPHPDSPPNGDKTQMDLAGVLSNQELQGRLRRVVGKLAAVRSNGALREPRSCRQRPRRPGWVVAAIMKVLADRDEPMRAKEIHIAVEGLIGGPVRWGSVKQALASHVSGPSPVFVRIGRGRYVLA